MKTVISILLSVLIPLLLFGEHPEPAYSEGDHLNVAATSGLRLRSHPDMNASTIRVIPYADSVFVENTFGFNEKYLGKLHWFDGHWIKVRYNGTAGYVFDAYLSSLTPPDHENQLCFQAEGLLTAFDRYLRAHNFELCIEEGPDHNEYVHQTVTLFDSGIESVKTKGDGWFTVEYTLSGYRMPEVVNLFRQMLVGDDLRNAFESGMTFFTDRDGKLNKVTIQFGNANPVEVIKESEIITVKSTIFSAEGNS